MPDGADIQDTAIYDWVRETPQLKQNYAATRVIWDGEKSALVPNALFHESQPEVYSRHVFELASGEILKHCSLEEQSFVFSIPQSVYYAARSKFLEADFVHQQALNLQGALSGKKDVQRICCFFSGAALQMIYVEDLKLQFHNSFVFSNKDEACYFIINVYEQLRLSRQRLSLEYAGIAPEHEIIRTLEIYITALQPIKPDLPEELSGEYAYHAFLSSI
jgi:hypothetical protein